MNKRRRIYRGFNRRSRIKKVKVISVIVGVSILGTFSFIKIKNSDFISGFSTNNIVSNIKDKVSFFSKFKPTIMTSEDLEKELNEIESDKETKDTDETETDVSKDEKNEESNDVKVATIEGWNMYTIQVASIQDKEENKDIEKIETDLLNSKIPFSIVEIDELKKVQTYSSFDEKSTRSHLEEVKKVFPDAFFSQVKVPVLALEYTSKYTYIDNITKSLNNLITNFQEESKFWSENEENIDKVKYNGILASRKEILDEINKEIKQIDYNGMDKFKEELSVYISDVDEKISESSKAMNEEKYHISNSLFASCMQGYFTFINKIKLG